MKHTRDTINIGGRTIGEGFPALIIAEIGNNHDGKYGQAKKLIREAGKTGCDVVKFQTHIAFEEMIDDGTVPAHFKEPRYKFVTRMQLTAAEHRALKKYAESLGLIFLSSPFSEKAADLLTDIGVSAFKIASGEVTNIPFLRYLARKRKPMLLSTGMSTIKEIDRAVDEILKYNSNLVLMQCTSKYPCPYEDAGLDMIPQLKKRYGLPVGFSDHTPTIYTSVASIALGSCAVEKHFTIDKTLYGPDHKASLIGEEMRSLVEGVRSVEKAMKPFDKDSLAGLQSVRDTFQKSIVAKRDIPANTRITVAMLSQKKPGTGIPAFCLDSLIGKRTRSAVQSNTLLRWDQVA
jgi:sialic acid synthase SpsE